MKQNDDDSLAANNQKLQQQLDDLTIKYRKLKLNQKLDVRIS